MTDPAVELWRSASARLRRVEQELDQARSDLSAVTVNADLRLAALKTTRDERDKALADRDALSVIADQLRAELTSAQQELARQRGDCAYKPLAITAIQERNDVRAQLDDAIHGFAEEVARLHRLLDQARRRVDVARDDYGLTCLLCDQPIVRGQAVEPQPGTTKGAFQHACCPTKEGN